MELFQFKTHVKPIWFTGNRVYQFPIQILQVHKGIVMDRYDCKTKIDGEFERVLTFDLKFNENWTKNENIPTEDVMSWALTVQTEADLFNDAFTGNHHVPHLPPLSSPFFRATSLLLCQQ